jgi:predicted nuclease of predicted toxin-antitoxin system
MGDNRHDIYLDQMFPVSVADKLRKKGYDVLRASETGQSRADDHDILATALNHNRTLITMDEHFGDWVILPLSTHPGVIRLKVDPFNSQNVLILLAPFLEKYLPGAFKNHLIILSAKREKWIKTG